MATLTTPYYNQNTDIDATGEKLIGDNTCAVTFGTVIKALPGNSGVVYISLTNEVVTTVGYPLSAGQEMTVSRAEAKDAGDIYIIASAANQGAAYRLV